MSTLEQVVVAGNSVVSEPKRQRESIVSRVVRIACSVRFGVTLLVLLAAACLVGMLVMQQNVDGFNKYFAELTPSQRLVYGYLGFFDIYHAWYFNALLAALSVNIILSSIDRFPKTWKRISRKNVVVPIRWLREQSQTAELTAEIPLESAAERVKSAAKASGWRSLRRTEKDGRLYLFAESGAWNRFGAYPVHVGLLTIFIGGFMTAQMGSTGSVPLAPGVSTDLTRETVVNLDKANEVTKRLPFELTGVDIQQRLIKKDGPITAMNTIDWVTRFNITDETGTHEASVQMNRPYDYRGYRFFQASFIPIGRARSITIDAIPANGGAPQTLTIARDGTAMLADGTSIRFNEFRGNFRIGPEDPNEDTSDYQNPAAVLQLTANDGATYNAYAFGPQMANIPVASKPVAGYTFQLKDFEKAADQHVLSVQRDPGATVVYVGFVLLCITLGAVFLFSHQRVWAVIEPESENSARIIVAGNTNRNLNSFDEKFKRFVKALEARSI